ncbi:MAG: YgcG family protein [Methylobacteriaceae bacterium]|nr:YgcG family protein [Methylobacteriaceae bacterium]
MVGADPTRLAFARHPPLKGREVVRRLPALFLIAVVFCATAFAALAALHFPELTGRVVDQANVLPAATRSALETKLTDLENKSGIQLVVATVASLEDNDVETYANQLFRAWKLGEKQKNNGVLLLVAPKERKVRIEVGYGLEGVLTDALSNVIITNQIVPRFKAGDFAGGIERGVDGIIAALTTDTSDWQKKKQVRTDDQDSAWAALLPFLIVGLFIFIFWMMHRHARGRRGGWGGPVFIPTGSWGGSSWGRGSSWGGGGGFGGGFSGGGGSSGGGGASGSW